MLKKIFILIIAILFSTLGLGILITKFSETKNNTTIDAVQEINMQNDEQETIIYANYLYDKENPIVYNISDPQKVKEIKDYINQISWVEIEKKSDTYFWKIEIEGKEPITLFMHGEYKNKTSRVSIKRNEEYKTYQISSASYAELIGFSNKKYYLHKSKLEKPSKENCKIAQKSRLEGLKQTEIAEIQKELRETHVMMEYMLIDAVRLIKEPDSPYWQQFTKDEVFKDPYSGVLIETDGFFDTVNSLKKIEKIIKEPRAKEEIKEIYTKLQLAMDKHDIEGCFKAHETIHDYDYWIINYPVYFETFPPADWGGIDTYFGTNL